MQFIIKRDPTIQFHFIPLQSKTAQKLLSQHTLNNETLNSIVVITDEKFLDKSDAVLYIAKKLKGFWFLLYIFKILPKKFRDMCYNFIAKNRYRFFGKQDVCMIPSKEIEKRFLV